MKHFYDESAAQRSRRGDSMIQARGEPSGLKLAIVGTGMMGREHALVSSLLGRAQVRGIYDANASSVELAKQQFARHSSTKLICYESLAAACDDPELDGLVVSTPNYTHWPVVQQLMGKVAAQGTA